MAVNLLVRAADYAALYHTGQKRKGSGAPYVNHPLRVAAILTEEGGVDDPIVIAAAMLHDTVEDTAATFDDLMKHFPHTVVDLVRAVTDDKSLPKAVRKQLQIDHTADPSMPKDVKLIKLADKLANLRDLQRGKPMDYTDERVLEYFVWAKKVTDNCRGINLKLDAALDKVYEQGAAFYAPLPTHNQERDVHPDMLKCPRCRKPQLPIPPVTHVCQWCVVEVASKAFM